MFDACAFKDPYQAIIDIFQEYTTKCLAVPVPVGNWRQPTGTSMIHFTNCSRIYKKMRSLANLNLVKTLKALFFFTNLKYFNCLSF